MLAVRERGGEQAYENRLLLALDRVHVARHLSSR